MQSVLFKSYINVRGQRHPCGRTKVVLYKLLLGIKVIHTFAKSFCSKVNEIANVRLYTTRPSSAFTCLIFRSATNMSTWPETNLLPINICIGLALWYINRCRLFHAKSIFIQINSSISNNLVLHKFSLNVKTVLFLTIPFSISTLQFY